MREYSGKTDKKARKSGSALARKSLWRWVFTKLERKTVRLNSTVEPFRQDLLAAKEAGVPVQKARSRTWTRVVKSLFYDLVYSLFPAQNTTAD